jgi:hypothetical protein
MRVRIAASRIALLVTLLRRYATSTFLFGLAVAMAMSSGSQQAAAGPNIAAAPAGQIYWTPTNLSAHIVGADRVVVTNRFADRIGLYQGFSLTISGRRVKSVVRAISSARAYPNEPITSSACDWEMLLYKRTTLLAAVPFQEYVIRYDGEYQDESGVLTALYSEAVARATPKDR